MTLKNKIKAYRSRWNQVVNLIKEERRSATLELRWKQLNSAYAMAKGLGMLQTDPGEMKVFKIWARLKCREPRPESINTLLVLLQALQNLLSHFDDQGVIIGGVAASHPNLDQERIHSWVEQFGEALVLPDLWTMISQLLIVRL